MPLIDSRSHLYAEAIDVLASNDTGRFIKPGPSQYPGQWNWDAAFNSIGLAHIDPRRARDEVRALLEGQWSDGMIPHIVFWDPVVDYFPGPAVWGRVDPMPSTPTSGITQPPLLATSVARIQHLSPDREFLCEVIGPIDRWHTWFQARRLKGGLVRIHHPWESGMDNSPRFDDALSRVGPSPLDFVRRDRTHVAPDQRPTDADYDAYISIMANLRDHQYRPPPNHAGFNVEDPFLTAMLARAENDLAHLCEAAGLDPTRPRQRAAGLQHALAAYLDAMGRSRRGTTTLGELLASYGAPRHRAVDLLVAVIEDPHTLGPASASPWYPTTVAKNHQEFDRHRYWRGPVWVNMNWFTIQTLIAAGHHAPAERLRQMTLQMTDRNGFWEYYDPATGTGLGSGQFSWSAALVIDLINMS